MDSKHFLNGDKGLIFDIQRFSLNDGNGIRTLIFFKGCPLNCKWCSNPESQFLYPEVVYNSELCINCSMCNNICYFWNLVKNNSVTNDNYACNGCGKCSNLCYSDACKLIGEWVDLNYLMNIVKRDYTFYRESNGGITVSGGEPTLQSNFLIKFLRECRNGNINTSMETCGYVNWQVLHSLLGYIDVLLFDIKHIESKKHLLYTGVENKIILSNAIKASNYARKMIVRLPLIKGFNDSVNTLKSIAEFVSNRLNNVTEIDILPYHSMGISKSLKLTRPKEISTFELISKENLNKAKIIFETFGFKVKCN